ncbi:hypothetical protein CMK11_00625 [Candidatus Poribacteria bacterium]|nr:hypothetical protein [Candidatus Poribacteria bacterium]
MDQALVLLALAVYPIASVTRMKLYLFACGAMAVVYVISHVFKGTAPLATIRLGWPVYAFVALAAASTAWSIDRSGTLVSLTWLVASGAVFHASLTLFRRQGRAWMTRVALFVPVAWVCVAAWVILRWGSFRSTSVEMGAVIGSLSNQGPAVTELAAPYLLYMVVAEPRRRLATFGAIGCALFLVVASQSRGALLLLGVTVALVAVLFGRTTGTKVRRTIALAVIGAGVVAILWGVLGPAYFSEPIERLRNSRMFDASDIDIRSVDEADYQRTVMYLEGINVIRAHGSTGIGYGALASYIEDIYGWRLISHNIIITAWGEMGLAGLALAAIIAVVGTRRVWIARSAARRVDARVFYFHTATLIAWVVALMHAQFRPQLSNPMFHVLAAAVFAAGVDAAPGSPDARHSG